MAPHWDIYWAIKLNPANWKKSRIQSSVKPGGMSCVFAAIYHNQHHITPTSNSFYAVIRGTFETAMKLVLRAEIFIRYVKTIRLLYRFTPGSLWCAWQRHSANPTKSKYRCSKHILWSQDEACHAFALIKPPKFQLAHQHLSSCAISLRAFWQLSETKTQSLSFLLVQETLSYKSELYQYGGDKALSEAPHHSVAFVLKANIWFGS